MMFIGCLGYPPQFVFSEAALGFGQEQIWKGKIPTFVWEAGNRDNRRGNGEQCVGPAFKTI